jgi:hypothetical protein
MGCYLYFERGISRLTAPSRSRFGGRAGPLIDFGLTGD